MAAKRKNQKKSKIPIGLRVPNNVHKKLKQIASKEKRSIANQAEYLILQALDNYDMPTDMEIIGLSDNDWIDTDEDLFDVVKKDKREPL